MVNTDKTYHLTEAGVEELKKELEALKKRRLEVADRLKEAKEQLDLTENSDWADAQDESKFVEGRINDIEHILRNVRLIQKESGATDVRLGSSVELARNGEKIEYIIVGSLEANPKEHQISSDSPLGKALLHKKVGDKVEIRTSAGETDYSITKIT